MRPVVVDFAPGPAATRRVPAVHSVPRRSVRAAHGSLVVEDRPPATESVPAMRLVPDRAVAADLGRVVIDGVSAASGVGTELSAAQLAVATDALLSVVYFPATAAVRGESVDLEPAAGGVRTVNLEADGPVGAAEMRDGAVHQSVAAFRVAGHQRSDALAADATSSVVYDAVTAARACAVLAR